MSENLEKKLDKAVAKVKKLKGEKKRLMIKAVVNYIESMAGETGE